MANGIKQYTLQELDDLNHLINSGCDTTDAVSLDNSITWVRCFSYSSHSSLSSNGYFSNKIIYLPCFILGTKIYENPLNSFGIRFPFFIESKNFATMNELVKEDYSFKNNDLECQNTTSCSQLDDLFYRGITNTNFNDFAEIVKNGASELPMRVKAITKIKKHTYLGRMFQLYTTKPRRDTYYYSKVIPEPEDSLYIIYSLLKIDIILASGDFNSTKVLLCYNLKTNDQLCLPLDSEETKKLLTTNDLYNISATNKKKQKNKK